MSIFTSEIPKPKNADDFEQLCLIVYRVAFGDPSATRNGRSGQKQNGVDIFVVRDKQRVGIQCKRVNFGELDSKTIDQEVGFADAGNVEISELIVATTAPNDAKLVKYVHELNKLRKKNCKFSVSLAFWDALESIIQQYSELQSLLAPNLPGGAYYNLAQQGQQMLEIQQGMATTLQSLLLGIPQSQLPEASQDSLNKVISAQLDEIKETISRGRFQDALDRLLSIGSAFPSFDGHQKYRWHSQRAVCLWRLGDKSAAALQYEDAFAIAPNEDKAAANFIRASLLLDRPKEAVKRAKAAVKNFPVSPSVWSVWANAKYVAGKTVNIESVPSELRHHGEVLHTFAWINVRIGKKQLAVEQSREAYLKEPASVDARNLFLACALTYATDDPIKVALEAVDQERKGFLTEAVTAFTPFRKKLWSIQDKEVLSEASLHIAYALQLLQRVPEAHSLLYEATQSFPDIQFLNRGFLECLIRENELDAAFTFGLDRIARLDIPGLALLAQLASNRVGSDGLEAIDKIKLHIKEGGRLLEDVEAFFWVSLWRNGKTSELKEKLLAEKFETELSVTKIAVAATLAKRMKETAAVEVLLARLNEVVAHVSEPGDILQAAETNFSCDKFEEAAQLFEGLLPKGIFSEYHEKLVYCLIKSNKRRRALEVLKTAPPESFAKENVRHLAIQLAQAANDWTELNHVAALELEAKKEYVDAWLLSCVVYTNQKQFERLRQLLESAPIDLKGQTRSMAGLANYDLQFGEAKKGMARLYRMFRSDLSNPSAASGYFAVSVSAPPLFFSDNVNLISPGTTINLRTDGSDRLITIDPVEAGELPSHPSFLSASNEIAVQLIGKRELRRIHCDF